MKFKFKKTSIFLTVLASIGVGSYVYISSDTYVTIDASETKILQEPKEYSKMSKTLDVPLILQNPELMRGCEVTSLAMLLHFVGIDVNKMELAQNITYEPFQQNGMMGDMKKGFVGDMKTFQNPGLGVYVGPIIELAEQYVPAKRIINLSETNPESLYEHIDKGFPVWTLTNALFKELPAKEFRVWNTEDGKTNVTYQQHSVVLTGYDENYVYVNDPLQQNKNRKLNRTDFEKAWIQMGRQAMTITV